MTQVCGKYEEISLDLVAKLMKEDIRDTDLGDMKEKKGKDK